jgi:hypothetical protein
MRMFGVGLEGHEVHNVDDADLEVGNALTEHLDRSQPFEGGDVGGAGHHHVGLFAGRA